MPSAIAIDLHRNKIYVDRFRQQCCHRDCGRTNSTANIAAGTNPIALAVDRTNHNIYVANRLAGTVSVINSGGAVIDTVPVGSVPVAIGINGATNKIYVVNLGSDTVTVIDGSTDMTTTVPTGITPNTVAVDQVRNQIYVANGNANCLTIIDGRTNAANTIGTIGNGASDIAVDVLTDRVYLMKAYPSASEVAVFSGAGGRFPLPLLDQLTGPVKGVR